MHPLKKLSPGAKHPTLDQTLAAALNQYRGVIEDEEDGEEDLDFDPE